MAMYYRCKACGGDHRSRIQMPRETFESPTTQIEKSAVTCPASGRVTTCDKVDMYWKDAQPSVAAAHS